MRGRRNFGLPVILAATAATPAFGQTVKPAVGPAAIPDFSGIWSHPSFPGFEPPASGPGPVVNTSRRSQGADADGRILPAGNRVLVSNPAQLVGDHTNPILKPQAAQVVKKHGEMELSGAGSPTPTIQCWPEPVPYIFNGVAMQMLQQPDKIIFLYPNDHQVRYVRMNQPHPAQVTPTWYGDSVGHYEGDTLVIDTIGQTVGPLSVADWYGTPISAALHVIERYRLIDGVKARDLQLKHEGTYLGAGRSSPFIGEYGRGLIDPDTTKPGLQVEITVEDSATVTTPWSALVTYRHVLGGWPEAICAENTRGAGSLWVNLVPQAEKPDF